MNNKINPGQLIKLSIKESWPKLWTKFTAVFIVAIVSMFFALLPPLILRRVIDNYIKLGITQGLWQAATLYLLVYLGSSFMQFLQTYLTSFIGQYLLYDMRLKLVTHLSKLSIKYYNKTPVGELISRVTSDVDAIDKIFSAGLINSITSLFQVFGVLAAMYIISPTLCFVSLIVLPIVYVLAKYFRKNMLQAQMLIRKSISLINTYLQEIFSGMRIIKSFDKENDYCHKFQQPLENSLKVSHKAAFYISAFPCVMQVLRSFIIALVVFLAAKTSVTDSLAISVGSLAAMIDLLARLIGPIESLSNQIQIIQQAVAGIKRVAELLSVKTEQKTEVESFNGTIAYYHNPYSIELQNVSFAYNENQNVVNNMSIKIPQGEKVALVGRTGAGKTTVMNLIAGLYAPNKGNVKIYGINPYNLNPNDRRKLIGIVPQQVVIFEGSVADNITLNSDEIPRDTVIEAAKSVGLHEFIKKLENGYDTVLGTLGMKLSFGQSQLLSIARAIVCNPPVLLLDEPTSQMDTITEEQVFKALRQASKQRTIITISHRLSGIVDADTVHIIANGDLVQSGSPEQLAQEKGWYQVYKQLEDLGWKLG